MKQIFLNQLWTNLKTVAIIIAIAIIIIVFVREVVNKLDEYIIRHLTGVWQNIFTYWHFLGVVCHELAHAFFSILFGFSIAEIKLFQKPTLENNYRFGYVKTNISFKENERGKIIWSDFVRGHLGISLIGFGPIIVILPLLWLLIVQIGNNQSFLIKIVCLICFSSLIWGLELSPIDLKNGFANIWALLIVIFLITFCWTLVQQVFAYYII